MWEFAAATAAAAAAAEIVAANAELNRRIKLNLKQTQYVPSFSDSVLLRGTAQQECVYAIKSALGWARIKAETHQNRWHRSNQCLVHQQSTCEDWGSPLPGNLKGNGYRAIRVSGTHRTFMQIPT